MKDLFIFLEFLKFLADLKDTLSTPRRINDLDFGFALFKGDFVLDFKPFFEVFCLCSLCENSSLELNTLLLLRFETFFLNLLLSFCN